MHRATTCGVLLLLVACKPAMRPVPVDATPAFRARIASGESWRDFAVSGPPDLSRKACKGLVEDELARRTGSSIQVRIDRKRACDAKDEVDSRCAAMRGDKRPAFELARCGVELESADRECLNERRLFELVRKRLLSFQDREPDEAPAPTCREIK